MSKKRCIIDDKPDQNLIRLADGNSICEAHAKLTPWQKEELIEKDANQVDSYIEKVTNNHLSEYGLINNEMSYKPLLHKAAESDLMKNVPSDETIKLQNWILIKQNKEIIKLLKNLNAKK